MKNVIILLFAFKFLFSYSQSSWYATNIITNINTGTRYEDIFFHNKDSGWAVSNVGNILNTNDGGQNWNLKYQATQYIRSVEFSSPKRGFAGSLQPANSNNSFMKTLDGGNTWIDISSVITATNKGICGICCVDTNVTYAVGVWSAPSYVIKTLDGGVNWTQINMGAYASRLVDVQFINQNVGYVTGQSNIVSEGGVVLKTIDRGLTWTKVFTSNNSGDYVWKIQNLDGVNWFGSIECGVWNGFSKDNKK